MPKLTTQKPRLKVMGIRRIKPVYGESRPISDSARVGLKRRIWVRVGAHCCMCSRAIDLHESELEHRVALGFSGDNTERTLTLSLRHRQPVEKRGICNNAPLNPLITEAAAGEIFGGPGRFPYFVHWNRHPVFHPHRLVIAKQRRVASAT